MAANPMYQFNVNRIGPEIKLGEIDIWNPHQIQGLQMMFMRNARRQLIEENATLPSDAINNALDNFWEQEHGSNGSTEQEKLL